MNQKEFKERLLEDEEWLNKLAEKLLERGFLVDQDKWLHISLLHTKKQDIDAIIPKWIKLIHEIKGKK